MGHGSSATSGTAAPARREDGSPHLRVARTPRSSGGRLRLLVLKLDHLGDFILALPALRKLRAEFPRDEVTLVCGSWNTKLAESVGIFDHVLAHDFMSRDRQAGPGSAVDAMTQLKSMLAGVYDVAIDLRPEGDTRFLLNGVEARQRMGFGPAVDHPFLDVALPFLPDTESRLLHTRRAYGPERFLSRVRGNDLYLETDFASTDDIIVFGPYVPLPAGDYIVTFHIQAAGLDRQFLRSSIVLDVAQDQVVLARRRLGFWRGRRELRNGAIAIPFSNRDPEGLFEFRIATSAR